MIRRFVLCAAALLALSVTAFGQGKVIKVYVTGEGNVDTTEVAQMVRGKIGGTLRYFADRVYRRCRSWDGSDMCSRRGFACCVFLAYALLLVQKLSPYI